MNQSRLMFFLLLLLIISCKDQSKGEFTETRKTMTNDSVRQQITAGNSPEKFLVKEKKPTNRLRKTRQITTATIHTAGFPLFQKTPQIFTIDQKNDTTLFCSEGTIIKISRSSFVYEDDDSNEPVEVVINVREYYKTDDIIFANLSTRSGDSILETGGMIFIEAVSGKRKCKLKEDTQFEISFPYELMKQNMQLFTGEFKNGNIDWIATQPLFRDFVVNSEKPEFPGGLARLQQFLNDNIEYPDSIAEKGHLRLTVSFMLDSLGNVLNPAINDSPFKSFNEAVLKAFSKMPKWKPAKMVGRSIRVFLKQQVLFYSSLALERTEDSFYKLKFEETLSDTSINEIATVEIRRYIFSSSKLGWINCDRFYNNGNPKIDLLVKTNSYPDVDVKIVFHNFKGVLDGTGTSLGYIFKGVPIGENITVIAIARQKDKNFISLTEAKTGSPINELAFEQVTMEVLKQKVAQLNDLRK